MKFVLGVAEIKAPIVVEVEDDVGDDRICQIIRAEVAERLGVDIDDEDFDVWYIQLSDLKFKKDD